MELRTGIDVQTFFESLEWNTKIKPRLENRWQTNKKRRDRRLPKEQRMTC